MKQHFKNIAILFSILLFSYAAIIFACADDYTEPTSMFTPESSGLDDSYKPLFLSDHMFYGNEALDNYTAIFSDSIVNEWYGFLNGAVNREDLSYFLLDTASARDVSTLFASIGKNQVSQKVARRLDLTNDKIVKFVRFLRYAKAVDVAATRHIDPWDYENVKPLYVPQNLIAEIEGLYTREPDEFIKHRYWFQCIKARFYSAQKNSVIQFFERTKGAAIKNTLFYRAVSYVAGAYYKQKKYAMSNYLYGIVFHHCKEMRAIATYNFHPQEQSDFSASLSMAKSDEEKIALWTLYGYYADEMQAIGEIYALNPHSEHLELLLARHINREEQRLNGEEFKSAQDYKDSVRANLNAESFNRIHTIAQEGKTSKPYIWYLAAGYLDILAGRAESANALFDKAQQRAPSTLLVEYQIRLLRLVNALFRCSTLDNTTEQALLAELRWLYDECPKDEVKDFRYSYAISWSKLYLASLYKAQGNLVYSELLAPTDTYYRTQINTEAMKQFLSRTDKSEWEIQLQKQYNTTLSDIHEYEALQSTYVSKGDVTSAIHFMQLSEHANDTLPADPFVCGIKDCHDCDHARPQKVKYTKLSFLRRISVLQSEVERGINLYDNYIQLANAFYSISYFGNSRRYYESQIMNQYGNTIDEYYQPWLLNSTIARDYYQRALSASSNREQMARCYYFIAKCERNDFYTRVHHSGNSSDYPYEGEVAFLEWDGFKKLRYEFSGTRFYREVIQECGYFSTYLHNR